MKTGNLSLSIRAKLTLTMTVVIALILSLISSFFYFEVNKYIESNLVERAIQSSKLITYELAPAVKQSRHEEVDQQVGLIATADSVTQVAVYSANKSIIGSYLPPQPEPELSAGTVRDKTTLQIVQPVYDSRNGSVAVKVDKDSPAIGYLYIKHDLNTLFARESYYYYFIALVFGVSSVLAIIISGFFQRLLTQPIGRMVRHISQIYHSKNFDLRLQPVGNDEIDKLTREFNQMLVTVQERENELTVHGKQLQRLVEVRTEQLYQKAHFDSLTGLPNRYLLVDRLHQAISKSARNQGSLALLFLDLDRFKIINDNLGHQNGDLLLKEVAKRLSKLSREGDTVARLGGDEFVFLLENLKSPEDAAITARRIIHSFKHPFRIQEHILHVSTSIGISIYPQDGYDDKILLKNADISMYHAKEKGPGHYSFYSDDMNKTSLQRLAIESNLRTAIENDEFHLLYQPQMRLKDNSYGNVEALLRWNNPEIGIIPPDVFVPIAEEMGLINQIDLYVITQACKQINLWKQQGLTNITVAVNISAGHLISDTLLEHLKEQISFYGVDASQLEIEITEAVFVEHTKRTIEILKAIKALGAKIAIDDFGTGYSSLQYIQDFPADTLKLDGMFIRNLSEKESSQGIVRSTILLAHSIGLEMVSECVENEFQLEFLRQHNCDLVQGYLLSKPLIPKQVVTKFRQTASADC